MDSVIAKDGYLVYEATGERVVFYECDPAKNVNCPKTMCRLVESEDHEFGFCAKTTDPACRRDGGRAFYATEKLDEHGSIYFGREYIEEG